MNLARRHRACGFAVAACVLSFVAGIRAEPASDVQLRDYEARVAAEPENLRLGAEYRQLTIASGAYDRAIHLFERVAKRNGGPNLFINLALAYADKVPSAGDLRRLYLGRDAMEALTRSITLRPSVLAYYMRGRINLYYNRSMFRRVDRGIADLERALSMSNGETPPTLVAMIYVSLGDGYFKNQAVSRAHEIWTAGLEKFPDQADLQRRLEKQGKELEWTVGGALAAERRVDTTFVGMLPDRR